MPNDVPRDGDRTGRGSRTRQTIPLVEVLHEREADRGWEFDVQRVRADGALEPLVLLLSWADYHSWAPDGTVPPSRVAEALVHLLALHAETFRGLARVDASTVRRRIAGADRLVAEFLRG